MSVKMPTEDGRVAEITATVDITWGGDQLAEVFEYVKYYLTKETGK